MVAALKAKVKKAKGKSEDEGQRASHQPSLMKDTLFAIRLFCLLPFYFCLPLRDGLLLLRPALLRAALLRPGFLAALLATLLRGRLVLLLAAARTALLAATRRLVDRGPRATLGLLLRRAALLVALLDVLGLSLLLRRVTALVSLWHSYPSLVG